MVQDLPPAALGAAMTPRFGPLVYATGLGWGLRRVRLEDHAAERIREAQEHGPVVYLLTRPSGLDHLALNAALLGSDLPLSVWAPGAQTGWWRPLGEAWRQLWGRLARAPADPVTSGWVGRALRSGHAITLFGAPDIAHALVDQLDPPAQVVPVQIAWNRHPRHGSAVVRFFSGQTDKPGLLRRLWRLWRRADVFVQVGQAIDLAQLAERVTAERLPKVLLRIAARTLYRESKLVRGPRLLPQAELARRVLAHPPLRELARQQAVQRGIDAHTISRELSRHYDRIAARFSWLVIRVLHVVLRPLWTRVFSGVDVPPADLERIREAMREGTPILVPNHRSHFDYVLMSWVLYDNDLIVPHVVAGMNLAVWPISAVLRGAGGFFIERSFSGQALFAAVFSRYLRELILREYPIEFFIEGGRSRSGKLLIPRLGVLSMVLDAASIRRRGREVTLLPISFTYEQVAEERVYAREIRGRRKRPESIGQFVRATRDVLRRRFGRVYLRVGEPIPCGPLVDPGGAVVGWMDRDPEARQQELEHLGAEIMDRIGRVVVVLAAPVVALALMAHPRRAIRHTVLRDRIDRFLLLLDHLGAPAAPSAEGLRQALPQAMDRFLAQGWIEEHGAGEERVWSIVPDERLRLDFYKNQPLHLLAEAGLAVCAMRGWRGDAAPVAADLLPTFAFLRRLWRREFVGDPSRDDAAGLDRGLAALEFHGAVATGTGGRLTVAEVERAAEILGLFLPLLEAYLLVLTWRGVALDRRAMAIAVLGDAGEPGTEGGVSRPEALSIDAVSNAISTLREDGVIVEGPSTLRVDEDAARGHVDSMNAMVGR